jgi:hypothetical protein
MTSTKALSVGEIHAMLEQLGLDPGGVDLEWLARVKHDTEERIAEHRRDPAFGAALAVSAEPTSE